VGLCDHLGSGRVQVELASDVLLSHHTCVCCDNGPLPVPLVAKKGQWFYQWLHVAKRGQQWTGVAIGITQGQ